MTSSARPPRRHLSAAAGDLGFLALAFPAAAGVALLIWFAWTIFTPHQFDFAIGESARVEVASYRGRLWVVVWRERDSEIPVVYGWETPPGAPARPPPPVLLTMLTWGSAFNLGWLGMSHTIPALLLMLPAMIAMSLHLWRRLRGRAPPQGFEVETRT